MTGEDVLAGLRSRRCAGVSVPRPKHVPENATIGGGASGASLEIADLLGIELAVTDWARRREHRRGGGDPRVYAAADDHVRPERFGRGP